MPVEEMTPPVVARPKACVSRSNSLHTRPPWAAAFRRMGSTRMPFRRERSISRPPSHTPLPATLWPPPRTAAWMPCSRAKLTNQARAELLNSGVVGHRFPPAYLNLVKLVDNSAAPEVHVRDPISRAYDVSFSNVRDRRVNHVPQRVPKKIGVVAPVEPESGGTDCPIFPGNEAPSDQGQVNPQKAATRPGGETSRLKTCSHPCIQPDFSLMNFSDGLEEEFCL